MSVHLRELEEGDLEALPPLIARVYEHPAPADGPERLRWLLYDNPDAAVDIPKGWVLCADGRLIGLLANVPRRMVVHGVSVCAACTAHYVVLEEHRIQGLRLAQAYFGQRGVDCLFVSSGNQASVAIFRRFGAEPISGGDETAMFILRGRRLAAELLRRRGWGPVVANLASVGFGGAIRLAARARRRRLARALDLRVLPIMRFDSGADDLWSRCRCDYTITSQRDSARLNWLFVDGPRSRRPRLILGAFRGARLDGYVVCQDRAAPAADVRRRYVMDLLCGKDDPDVFDALVAAAFRQARRDAMDTLEFPALSAHQLERLASRGAWRRHLEVNPFMVQPLNGAPPMPAGAAASWHLVASDGDGAAW